MALALQAWRATNAEGRKRLKHLLKETIAAMDTVASR